MQSQFERITVLEKAQGGEIERLSDAEFVERIETLCEHFTAEENETDAGGDYAEH